MRASIPRAALLGIVVAIVAGTWLVPGDQMAAQTMKTIAQATLEEPNQKTSDVSTDELRGILADRSAVIFDARPPRSTRSARSRVP